MLTKSAKGSFLGCRCKLGYEIDRLHVQVFMDYSVCFTCVDPRRSM